MRWSPDSFRLQTAVIGLASLSMAALAVILIRDVLSSAEETLLREAEQQCASAAKELHQQFAERASLEEDPLEVLPFQAQDLSLRGLSGAVLRSYEGIEGGFVVSGAGRIAGYANPTLGSPKHDPAASEERQILELIHDAPAGETEVVERVAEGTDWLVYAVTIIEPRRTAAWALKRLVAARDPVVERRRWWLAGLVLSALVGLGGVISISVRLRQGVDAVNEGLRRLEKDFSQRLPAIQGDFGQIAEAINRMADRRMALERTVRQQDRLAALGKVVAGVAHEIRNPLNSIRLSLELLRRRVKKGAALGEEVEGPIEEVDRLDQILARLLAFGRPDLEDRRVQPVSPLIGRAVKMVQEQSQRKSVQVCVEDEAQESTHADVDGLQVEQVLINLLLNAIEASPEGSVVRLRSSRRNSSVRVSVTDQGPGIAESVRDHVFDPYFTTKKSGSGLGLSVSREVVAHHGGSLDFETNADGTTFTMELPLKRSQT